MKVKICGMTNSEDARAAAEFGADALGFIFAPESPRFVSADAIRKILSELPPFVVTVGVFTSGAEKDFKAAVEEIGVDLIQFHGSIPPEWIHRFAHRAIKAIGVRDARSLEEISQYPVRAFVLDSYHEKIAGGSGIAFNWELAKKAKSLGRIILAGGLTPENVAEAIRKVQPYGVDVCSGVEMKKGKKDLDKLRRFIQAAKTAGGVDAASE